MHNMQNERIIKSLIAEAIEELDKLQTVMPNEFRNVPLCFGLVIFALKSRKCW